MFTFMYFRYFYTKYTAAQYILVFYAAKIREPNAHKNHRGAHPVKGVPPRRYVYDLR